MSEDSIFELIASILELDVSRVIDRQDNPLSDLGWDSLSTLELIAKVDSTHSIAMTSEFISDSITPRQLYNKLSQTNEK